MAKRRFYLWFSEEAEKKQLTLHDDDYKPTTAILESGEEVWYSWSLPVDEYDKEEFEKNSPRSDLQYLGIGTLVYESQRTGGVYH